MTTIKVPDMMCENCVKRITNALTAAELTFRVDLAAKRQRTPEKAPVSGFGYRYFFNRKSVTNCNFYGSKLEKTKK